MVPEARQVLDAATTERDYQNTIVTLANLAGWTVYHNPDSRRSTAGHPDLVLVHDDRTRPIVYLEVKTEKGRVSPAQQWWLDRLDLGPALQDYVVARVVRPSDWPWVEALLTGRDDWREAS